MLRSSKLLLLLFLTGLAHPLVAANSQSLSAQALAQVMSGSGYIFAGTVTAVQRTRAEGVANSVEITFHVDRGVRGVVSGQSFTIHEWSGLWATGEQYVPGQQVMLFLYKPSKLGLTSPVAGPLGRLDIDRDGGVLLQPEWQAGLPTGPALKQIQPRLSVKEFARALRRRAEK